MPQSIHDLERDVEESRSRLDLTIDRIQDKLSMSGIVDDLLGQARQNRYASTYDTALEVVRRNPVPVMLIAAGIGWLLYRAGRERRAVEAVPFRPYDDAEMPATMRGRPRAYSPAPTALDPLPEALDGERDLAATGTLADPHEKRDPLAPLTAAPLGPRL